MVRETLKSSVLLTGEGQTGTHTFLKMANMCRQEPGQKVFPRLVSLRSESFYDTFDPAGNVRKWNEALTSFDLSRRGYRGGSWLNDSRQVAASWRTDGSPPTIASNVFTSRLRFHANRPQLLDATTRLKVRIPADSVQTPCYPEPVSAVRPLFLLPHPFRGISNKDQKILAAKSSGSRMSIQRQVEANCF
jgi:hypothetical protein